MPTQDQDRRTDATQARERGRLGSSALLASIALVVTGIIHLALAPEHLAESAWLGTLFVIDGIGLTVLGIALFVSPGARTRRAAAAGALLTVAAFALSRSIGLPDMARESLDTMGVLTTAIEALVAASLLRAWRGASRTLVALGVITMLATAVVYTAAPPTAPHLVGQVQAHDAH